MRIIQFDEIKTIVSEMCLEANYNLPQDVSDAFDLAVTSEKSQVGQSILNQCIKNIGIAKTEKMPICQDTGIAVFFVKIGADVKIEGGLLTDAINQGVKLGYSDGYLRKSVLKDPLYNRVNTTNNTPAIIHLDIVKGDQLDITFAPKGGGAENMSKIAMLPPSAGEKGVIDFVVDTIVAAGGNACPPIVVGIGLGGTFEKVAFLAKKALLWPLNKPNVDVKYNALEKTILDRINASGIGPQGLGGNTTCFSVHIEHYPCHLASLPVAVNINCHVHRHTHRVL